MRRVMFATSSFTSTLLDIPRAHIDPIDSLIEALSVVAMTTERPLRQSTTSLFLDSERRGVGLSRTYKQSRDAVHHVISEASRLHTRLQNVESVVVVSTRDRHTVEYADGDEFLSMTQLLSHAGITLVEWVVIGRGGVYCPRSLTDAPSLWVTP